MFFYHLTVVLLAVQVNKLIPIFDFLSNFYNFLSPYLKIAFGAWITAWLGNHYFFEKFFAQRNAERISQINNRRDLLNKEIFDQISQKVEEIYLVLGGVRNFTTLFEKAYKDRDLGSLKLFNKLFFTRYSDLQDKLNRLYLMCEKYDFIIINKKKDYLEKLWTLETDFHRICSTVDKTISLIIEKGNIEEIKEAQIKSELKELFDICSKINLSVKEISDQSKSILQNLFKSLDEMENSFNKLKNEQKEQF